MNIKVKGDGLFKIRGNKIYVHGTIDKKFYRKSTGKKVTPATKQWIKKADPLKVLAELLKVDMPIDSYNSFEQFGYDVLKMTSSRRGLESQADTECMFKNRILPAFKNFRIEDIKPNDIVTFIENQKKELSGTRAKRIKNLLALILDFAIDAEIIVKNPAKSISVNLIDFSHKIQTETYDTDEIALILENSRGWFKIFLDISFKTGIRTGECMALKWEDIDLTTGRLILKRSISRGKITTYTETNTNNKNKNHFRLIQLFPDTLELLNSYYLIRPSDEWLFVNKDSRYFRESKTIVDYHLKPLLKKINVKYKTLYATRRSYASIFNFGGESLDKIQETMGHAKGSNVTKKHYIDPRVLKLHHEQKNAKRQQKMFNLMIKG